MHSPSLAATLAAIWIGLAAPGLAHAGHDAVEKARALLAKGDAKAAVVVLERALGEAGPDLGPMIVVLRQAYTRAADRAAKEGRAAEADEFRENLQILNRRMRGQPDEPAPSAAKTRPPAPVSTDTADRFVAPVTEAEAPAAPPRPSPPPAPDPSKVPAPDKAVPSAEPPPALPSTPPAVEPPAPAKLAREFDVPPTPATSPEPAPPPRDEPSPRPPAPRPSAPSPEEVLTAGDYAYLAGRYLDANKNYAALAKAGALPADRKIHWAYCRSVDVVRRIKANPATEAEWASIDREIAEIKALSPKYWYAEYLRNRAADRTRVVARKDSGRVLRGAMPESDPDDPPTTRAGAKKAIKAADRPRVAGRQKAGEMMLARAETEADANAPPMVTTGDESANWQVKQSANFTIYHADPELAERVAKVAESTRASQSKRWSGSSPPRPWSPKCEVYIYPTAAIFAQVTGQPAESPGFSTMDANGSAIVGRRIKLRADHPGLVDSVLPHEVTHVILADLFPSQQIPRWADEGIAVLSEPPVEQEKRLADLDPALDGGRIFSVEHLMVRDYPEGKFWALYYAQSVSLTRFLVIQGTPGQFIDFLQGSQRSGVEPELRRVYKIDGYADLQSRWLTFARSSASDRLAKKDGTTRR